MSIVQLPRSPTFSAKSDQLTLSDRVASFLADHELARSSHRAYRMKFDLLVRQLGADAPLAAITADQLREHIRTTYRTASPRTWNHAVAVLRSFYAYASRQGWSTSSPVAAIERRRERLGPDVVERTRAIPKDDLRAFLNRPHPLRQKTLWWLLYESAARAQEALQLDIEHLDLPNRRATIIGKGGSAEQIAWETTTARLLPRLIGSRRR